MREDGGSDHNSDEDEASRKGWGTWVRIGVAIAFIGLFAVLFFMFRDQLTLTALAEKESQFREYRDANPAFVYVIAFAIYIGVTALSLPGAAAMTLLLGWLFGFWRAVILVSFASTMGATLACLLSRYVLREAVQSRFEGRLKSFNEALEREGAFYLFTLRLIPAVPFFVINVVMGLTPIAIWTFWWVSQVGMLPGTAVYVYAGATVPSLQKLADDGISGIMTRQVIAAFVVLGIFPLAVKKGFAWFKPEKADQLKSDAQDE